MSNPVEISEGEPVERLSLDVRVSDVAFLERFAKYRNALAKAQGKKLKRKWSRKALMESLLAIQVDQLRQQLRNMMDVLGELPAPTGDSDEAQKADAKAMDAYAKRAAAWVEKHSK